jgi:type VI protein secretion system component Hcp
MDKPWITIKLSQIFVTHLEQSMGAGDDSPSEVVHFAYEAMNMAFNQQSAQDTTTPVPSVSWNQVTNQATLGIPGE